MKKKNSILHVLSKTLLLFLGVILYSSSLFAAPVNDECSNAISLSSNISCNNQQYNIRNVTASSGIPVGCASGGTLYDIWFQFTATSNSHTVTISNRATSFNNPEVQMFSGSCASLTSLVCGTTTITGTGLTIGNIYYIRVSNVGAGVNGLGTFDICVTNPPAVPSNDDCSNATALTVGGTCINTAANIYYATSSSPAGACGGATASTTYDVWFRFQATATSQTVTLSNLGARINAASTYIQMLSGSCGSLTSLGCQTAATRQTVTGLTIGTFYYVRVYVLLAPTASPSNDWNFNICIQQPPVNDECTGAISLTPGLACTNTAGSLDLATINAATPLGCFAAGNYYDVWYSFVATSTFHTITLSSLGSGFSAPRIQIYSGNCGALVSMSCASATTITQAGLTIGQTYYIRVANFNVNPSGTGGVANFNICVTFAGAPPSNDLCTGAISLTSGAACSNISGTIHNATASSPAVPGACGIGTAPDVWFSFVANSAYPQINLSSIGTNLQTNGRIQLLTGSCGSFVTVGSCHPIPAAATTVLNTATNPGGAGLIVGQTYYIRITHNSLPFITTNGNFNICVTNPVGAAVDYGKSYINVTNGTSGGTVKPGDVLEIRATLVVARPGGAGAIKAIDSIAYYDTLSAGKGFAFVPGSIALRTNEGKIYKTYTDAYDVTDAGWYTTAGAGTDTAIQINMGLNATYAARGKLRSNSRPSFNSGSPTCIVLATYRVTVNASYDTKINFGGGAFTYRDTLTGNFYTISFPRDSLIVYQSPGICPNSVSATNVLGDEINGTFGAPTGSPVFPQNRGTSPNTNYTYIPFGASSPNDYYYAVANNTSAAGTTVQTLTKSNAARVHSVWDISGDHTGATNTSKGNLPCNLSQPISATNPCGYMLVVNSAYRTDTAFQFNVSGACTDTYYEISAWFKNVCYKCGCDSTGRFAGPSPYIPTAAGDSAGVRPNIAIKINGTDYYTTGDILYQGLGGTQTGSDTLNSWVQRAFIFKTSPNQTNFTMTFRNNAPGGGGNDWAIDDISLKTCLPSFQMNPSNAPSYCQNGQVDMSVVVSSYYNTYTYYTWERSTDGGSTWEPAPELPGTQNFTYTNNGVNYVDTVMYPSILATSSINGYQYRIKTASSEANLASSSCTIANNNDVITINVLSSCDVLPAEILKFNVQLKDEHSILNWSVKQEQNLLMYEIERSSDGKNFTKIGTVNAKGLNASEEFYLFNDPTAVLGKIYYRLKLIGQDKNTKYSNILSVSLAKANVFELTNLVNPVDTKLSFQVLTYQNEMADLELLDASGRIMLSRKINLSKGINALTFDIPAHLQKGSYLLSVKANAGVVNKVIQKL